MTTDWIFRSAFLTFVGVLVPAINHLQLAPAKEGNAPAPQVAVVDACKVQGTISSNFNGTPIQAGNYIWFNAIVKVQGLGSQGGDVLFFRNVITFTANNVTYRLDTEVPESLIRFSPTATQATTTFDSANFRWITTVPTNYNGNVFAGGYAFPVPVDLPGGINPVSWSTVFVGDQTGLSFQWKWAAAVYTGFSTNPSDLCVKPVDGSFPNPYLNSDHAGTPECFKTFVTGGARGGGGSNWTGSYSGTETVHCQ